jgi:23S rRNA (uracil1939-C5)-methyltransferase
MTKKRRNQPAMQMREQSKAALAGSTATQLVQIEKPIYGGSFLARAGGKAVFIPLALPGESIRARITEEKRGYSTAEIDEIATPSTERITPACSHFGSCGGCHYQHTGYANQLRLKQSILRETLERGGVPAPDSIEILAGTEQEAWKYRNRIRLAFDAKCNPGYRGSRSNAVVPISECPIAAPLLVRAAIAFATAARQTAPQLSVEEISLLCDAEETSILASVFVRSVMKDAFDKLAHATAETIPELKGIEFAQSAGGHKQEHTPHSIARWGVTHMFYRTAGFRYRVDHGAFFQVNRYLVDRLVEQVTARKEGTLAWDLFAGVGLFARKLTKRFERVVAVESAAAAMPGLEANLHGTTGTAIPTWTAHFLHEHAKGQRPDLIVLDPPRAGLGAEITAALGEIGAPALTYVSCDPATLARDLRALLTWGYTIESMALADLFPQTFHLETVVHLRRS